MMPRIEAIDILNASTAAALGSGTLKTGDAHRLWSTLERRANLGTSRAPKAPKLDAATLAMMGIGLEVHDG